MIRKQPRLWSDCASAHFDAIKSINKFRIHVKTVDCTIFEPFHEILKSFVKHAADPNLVLNIHLHPCFVFPSRKGSSKIVQMHRLH